MVQRIAVPRLIQPLVVGVRLVVVVQLVVAATQVEVARAEAAAAAVAEALEAAAQRVQAQAQVQAQVQVAAAAQVLLRQVVHQISRGWHPPANTLLCSLLTANATQPNCEYNKFQSGATTSCIDRDGVCNSRNRAGSSTAHAPERTR